MTAVEFLIEQIITDHNKNALTRLEWMKVFEQAKEMEKAATISKKEMVEISDEEIEKASIGNATFAPSFINGAKWYREQLRQRK